MSNDFNVQRNIDEMALELEKTFKDEVVVEDKIPTMEDLKNQGISVTVPSSENVRAFSSEESRVTDKQSENVVGNVKLIDKVVTTPTYDGLPKGNINVENVEEKFESDAEVYREQHKMKKAITEPINVNEIPDKKTTAKESDAMKMAHNQSMNSKSNMSPEDFLNNLTVDLNNIDVVEENPLNKFKNFNFIMNRKSKSQIVAIQSGYVAYVEGYNYDDINALTNSSLDDYANQLLLCQTVFNSINNSSIGRISFDKWCELTSYYDLDSFLYGNYLETFPGNTTFTVKCGTCNKEIEVNVNNDTLISAKNPETKELLDLILASEKDSTETVKKAILNIGKKIFLPDSKVIVNFKLPSIKKHLDLLSSINAKAKKANQHVLTFLLFIEEMYMLDLEASLNAGSPKYNKITDNTDRTRIIKNFSYSDAKLLSDAINELINKYQISFRIKSFTCGACGNPIGDVPVDMESLLFFRMSQ